MIKDTQSLNIGDTVYYIQHTSREFRDEAPSDCLNKNCIEWRNRYGDKCGRYNCGYCKGYGQYIKRFKATGYEVKKIRVLDIKRSGDVQTGYDPGFDGGWGGDYYESSEEWKSGRELFHTREEAEAEAISKSLVTMKYLEDLWKADPDKIRSMSKEVVR